MKWNALWDEGSLRLVLFTNWGHISLKNVLSRVKIEIRCILKQKEKGIKILEFLVGKKVLEKTLPKDLVKMTDLQFYASRGLTSFWCEKAFLCLLTGGKIDAESVLGSIATFNLEDQKLVFGACKSWPGSSFCQQNCTQLKTFVKGVLISLSSLDFESSLSLLLVLKIEVQKKSRQSAEMCIFVSNIIFSVSFMHLQNFCWNVTQEFYLSLHILALSISRVNHSTKGYVNSPEIAILNF